MSALCHKLLTWPMDASRGGVARWKGWERWLSARVTVEKGVVGFGLDYACAHIIILAEISSENLLPIRADFVTERDKGHVGTRSFVLYREVSFILGLV